MILSLFTGCSDLDNTTYRFIGDSIVARWGLQNSFPTLITRNSGNSGSGIKHLESFKGQCGGEIAVVLTGTNDVGTMYTEQEMENYAEQYVEALTRFGAETIYVFSILPRNFKNDPYNLLDKITTLNALIEARIEAAQNKTIVYLDVYDDFLDGDGRFNMNLSYDGLHLNPEGYEILTRKLNHYIF